MKVLYILGVFEKESLKDWESNSKTTKASNLGTSEKEDLTGLENGYFQTDTFLLESSLQELWTRKDFITIKTCRSGSI